MQSRLARQYHISTWTMWTLGRSNISSTRDFSGARARAWGRRETSCMRTGVNSACVAWYRQHNKVATTQKAITDTSDGFHIVMDDDCRGCWWPIQTLWDFVWAVVWRRLAHLVKGQRQPGRWGKGRRDPEGRRSVGYATCDGLHASQRWWCYSNLPQPLGTLDGNPGAGIGSKWACYGMPGSHSTDRVKSRLAVPLIFVTTVLRAILCGRDLFDCIPGYFH